MRRVRRATQTVLRKVTSTRLPCWLLGAFYTIRGQSLNENLPACSFVCASPTNGWRRFSRDSSFKRCFQRKPPSAPRQTYRSWKASYKDPLRVIAPAYRVTQAPPDKPP